MAKYKDKIDLYDDRGKLIEKDVPLDAISPLYNPAIQTIASLAKRAIAVDLLGIEKSLKTGRVGGGYIKGKEIDAALVANADKIAKAIKDIIKVEKDDDTDVRVLSEGKKIDRGRPIKKARLRYRIHNRVHRCSSCGHSSDHRSL